MELSTVSSRERLPPRINEPYWHRLAAGKYLGYRVTQAGRPGRWIARHYDPGTRRYQHFPLGTFEGLPAAERYDAAKRAAEEWLLHMDGGGNARAPTVRKVCEAYVDERPKTDAQERFKRSVYADPIAEISIAKLRRKDVDSWRRRLSRRPAKVSRRKEGTPVTRPRSASTVNRDMAVFKAALNLSLRMGDTLTDRAWREALKPARAESKSRRYLTRQDRRSLLEHAQPDIQPFLRALILTPLRPGAVAHLVVGDYDQRTGELEIRHDKGHGNRKILLPPIVAALFKEQCRSKLPGAPIFTRADGKPWDKDAWKGPIHDAVSAAGLPQAVSCYNLRHSALTDLCSSGIDVLTVSKLSGTSVAMLEKFYFHLRPEHGAAALESLTL